MGKKVIRREDYLKQISKLSALGQVRGSDLACILNVSRPTVSVYLKQLIADGDITMDRHHAVHLTQQGLSVAMDTREKHDTLFALLRSLGVPEAIADEDACAMEHNLSPESLDAMKQLLKERRPLSP